jgi:hypothetical protein
MGFPNPKLRNIEKDVKVFSWKVLGHALKKIVGKYVSLLIALNSISLIPSKFASYSLTAGALYFTTSGKLLTPVTSLYASTEHSEASTVTHRTASPRPGSDFTSISTYVISLTFTAILPRAQ